MDSLRPGKIADLERRATEIRIRILETVHHAGAGHVGGPLSAADILAALYFHVLRIDPDRPDWADRDRFIMSKGHSSPALYAALAIRGYFPLDELHSFDGIDSRLQAHPDMTRLPGVDMSTGSLGQGLSAGLGMTIAARLSGKAFRTYVLLGDGECQEGQVWEAAIVAARYHASTLTAIVDWNGLQQYGWPASEDPSRQEPPFPAIAEAWAGQGWRVVKVDGHSIPDTVEALDRQPDEEGRPTCIIARTTKGKGVSFMEDRPEWHSRVVSDADLRRALQELQS